MRTLSPRLPPSPLAPQPPDTGAEVRLPWSTLAYGAALGMVTAPLAKLAIHAVVVRSPLLRLAPTPPPSPPTAAELAQEALWGTLTPVIACLALVAADRVGTGAPRWLRWAVALGIVGLLPVLVFVPGALHNPRPTQYLMLFLPAALGALLAMAAAGALMAVAARAGSGLLWKLPLIAAAAALLVPAADALATAVTISPRAASLSLSATSLAATWLAFAPGSLAAAFGVAIALRAARRKAGAARGAPTEA